MKDLHTYRIINRKGIYTAIVSYTDSTGKHKQKWISSGIRVPLNCLEEKNNGKLKITKEVRNKLQLQVYKWEEEFGTIEGEKSDITVSEFFLAWQDKREEPRILSTKAHKSLSPTTLAADRTIINRIAAFYGDKKLVDLTAEDILDYLEYHAQGIKGKKPSPNTTHKHWLKIKQVLDNAVKQGLISENPAKSEDVEPATVRPKEGQVFHPDELQKIFTSLNDDPIEIAVYLLFFGVLRREEACGLDWSDVDMIHKEFRVRQVYQQISDPQKGKMLILTEKTKTDDTARTQPMSDMLFAALSKVPEEERIGPVCRGINGDRLEPEYLSHHFSDVQVRLKIPHRRLYDLRHTVVTFLLSKDCAFPLVQVLAGHKRQETTSKFYLHYGMDKKREAIAILDSFFQE